MWPMLLSCLAVWLMETLRNWRSRTSKRPSSYGSIQLASLATQCLSPGDVVLCMRESIDMAQPIDRLDAPGPLLATRSPATLLSLWLSGASEWMHKMVVQSQPEPPDLAEPIGQPDCSSVWLSSAVAKKQSLCCLARPASFHPERVLFRPGGVNLRSCLCGVPTYASAQILDFLARTKNPSFPNRKLLVFIRRFRMDTS